MSELQRTPIIANRKNLSIPKNIFFQIQPQIWQFSTFKNIKKAGLFGEPAFLYSNSLNSYLSKNNISIFIQINIHTLSFFYAAFQNFLSQPIFNQI